MNTEITSRFADCVWFKPMKITIVGLGGVGRGVAETLAIQGHQLIVYDEDTIEAANAVQGYQRKYIGWNKAEAFRMQMSELIGDVSSLTTYDLNWSVGDYIDNIVIAAADNWEVLTDLYEQWREQEGTLFISPGMLADMSHINVYLKDDGREWIPGTDTEKVNCTTKASMYMAKYVHGRVVSIVNQFTIDPNLIENEYRFNGILD